LAFLMPARPEYAAKASRTTCKIVPRKAAIGRFEKAIDLGGARGVKLMALDGSDLKPLWGKIEEI